MRPLTLSLALLMLLALPGMVVADDAENARLEELWKTGSLWQVGDNIPKVEAARKAIVAEGDAGLAFIFTKLSSTDGLEYRCIEAVFKGFGAKALPGLCEHMGHEDVKVRRNVAAMLGVIDDKSAGTKMVEHLKKETDLRCRVGHLQTLARWKEPTALDPLIECTKTTQEQEPLAERLKVRIVPLLANYEDEKAIACLIELLNDDAYFIRDAARDSLVSTNGGRLRIKKRLSEVVYPDMPPSPLDQTALIAALPRVQGDDYAEFAGCVRTYMNDTDAKVRGEVARMLGTLEGAYVAAMELTHYRINRIALLEAALKKETDPYALACIEGALNKLRATPRDK